MNLDKFSNPVFNNKDLFELIYQGHLDTISQLIVEDSEEIKSLESQSEIQFNKRNSELDQLSVSEFDNILQSDWFMPDEYKTLDIEAWCIEQAPPWDPEYTRVVDELAEFKQRNMLNLLRWLKYFVDTMRSNNIVWGVGRGSSVSSYVLYLIGVHKINPIKYNLDWQEFLR